MKTLKQLFHKSYVLDELKSGALSTRRVFEILNALLIFSVVANLISSMAQIFLKELNAEWWAQLVAIIAGTVVLIIFYFVTRYVLHLFYEANGGENGQHFLERLFLLGTNTALRVSLVLLPVFLIFSLLIGALSGPFIASLSFFMILLAIGAMVWSVVEIKKGLKTLSGN